MTLAMDWPQGLAVRVRRLGMRQQLAVAFGAVLLLLVLGGSLVKLMKTHVDPERVLGENIDRFHPNPAYQLPLTRWFRTERS